MADNKKVGNCRRILIITGIVACLALLGLIYFRIFVDKQEAPLSFSETKQAVLAENDYPGLELTEKEKIVDEKINRLRNELIEEYGNALFNINLLADDAPVESELYKMCTTIPKGADLHTHFQAMLDFNTMLELAESEDAYICLDEGKNFGKIGTVDNRPADDILIYVPIRNALAAAQVDSNTLKHYWTSRDDMNAVNPWGKFAEKRFWLDSLYANTLAEYQYYVKAFKMYLSYGVPIIELRDSPLTDTASEKDYAAFRNHLRVIEQAYYNVKEDHPELIVRVIVSPSHRYPAKNSEFIGKVLNSAIKLYDEFPDKSMGGDEHLIIGFDLVGEEDVCYPLSEYSDMFEKTPLPDGFSLYLHCGESLKAENSNLIDAYMYGAKRVGHGFNLYKFPNLLEQYKEADITLEICPVSNLVLGYTQDLRRHPAIEYMKRRMNIVLASDDAQYFEYKTLVDDYFLTVICWNLNLSQLKMLSQNAVLSSSLKGEAREQALENWQKSWDAWIDANM